MHKVMNDTETRILEASRRIFNRLGYQGMTLRLVAREVGIEVQSIYNYVSSKQSLIERIVRFGTSELHREVVEAIKQTNGSATDRLFAAVRTHVINYASSPYVVTFFRNSLVHFDEETRISLLEELKEYEGIFKMLLSEGVETGEFRHVQITSTAFAILGMGESVINWWQPDGEIQIDDLGDLYADLAIRMVRATTAANP